MTSIEQARRVIEWCRTIAACSEEPGATTRTFLSAPMRDVHAQLTGWMTRLGMAVSVDAAGNLRGVRAASAGSWRRLYIGSHLDTVPRAGAFDGILGVVLAIALVERFGDARLPFAIEVVGFSDEEGVRFGAPFIGSRALAGTLDEQLLNRPDANGVRVRDAISAYGLDVAQLDRARAADDALGYLEFHIEQGPVLDHLDLPIGVVDAIVGQSRALLAFAGVANHAGTTPMRLRRDALAGAAEWIVAVEYDARSTEGLVATVGRIEAEPGAGNVIAGRCSLTLDVRHAQDSIRHAAVRRLVERAQAIAGERGLTVTYEPRLDQSAVALDPRLIASLEHAVRHTGHTVRHLSSGAGHDAMIMASCMPAAMLFVRSPGGISHHPDESVRVEDVAAALDAGARWIEEIARG